LPARRYKEFFGRTVLVNRTTPMRVHGSRFAVNPGIPPAYIAAAHHGAFRAYEIRPRVLAGTAPLRGAIQVRAEDLRRAHQQGNRSRRGGDAIATRETFQPSRTLIQPARSVPPPQALARGEAGRLGSTPPVAARGAVVDRSTAQRLPANPSAQQPTDRRANERREGAVPNARTSGSAQPAAGPRPGVVEQRPATPQQPRHPVAAEHRPVDRTPVARAPITNHAPVPHAPVAAAPRPAAPVAAAPRPAPPPAVVARPAPPPAAVARPAPPPTTTGAAPHGPAPKKP
jgi:hypothetical protein